jgi:hypothetical protein
VWSLIPSMTSLFQALMPAFTSPSFSTHAQIFLGWVMCLGRHTEFQTFEAFQGSRADRHQRHPFDRFYNFFSRSAWTVKTLAYRVALKAVLELNPQGELLLAVDGTLLHKSGKHVFGVGWFRDPVRSTKKRVATALGNKWVVMGLVVQIPGVERSFCLPIHAMLDEGKTKGGEPLLARRMLKDIQSWFPDREITLVADGGFSAKTLLKNLNTKVRYVGLMRSDAALHNPIVPPREKGQLGPDRKIGERLPCPREAIKKANRAKSPKNPWHWNRIEVFAYGQPRRFDVCCYQATWPRVFGQRAIQVILCRPLDKGYDNVSLYTTDLDAEASWVVETYALRNTIESLFKSSKQVMEIEKPQHWCKSSIQKLAPWVWLSQTIVMLWYLSEGRLLPEAETARSELGPWESEWSFRHMFRFLRRLTIRQTINHTSLKTRDMAILIESLENYLYLAA